MSSLESSPVEESGDGKKDWRKGKHELKYNSKMPQPTLWISLEWLYIYKILNLTCIGPKWSSLYTSAWISDWTWGVLGSLWQVCPLWWRWILSQKTGTTSLPWRDSDGTSSCSLHYHSLIFFYVLPFFLFPFPFLPFSPPSYIKESHQLNNSIWRLCGRTLS